DPTPFAGVNVVLEAFHTHIQALLQGHFLGMYLVGSLALGDFDPSSSDIDFVVVTNTDLAGGLVRGLAEIHAQFAASPSPWATRIEAVYIPRAALRTHATATRQYPQIEKGTTLAPAALEDGWVFQCWTLRERGLVVAGRTPGELVAPIQAREMHAAVAAIAGGWADAARHDPAWLDWLRHRPHHAFVVQTLCRMLYSLATGAVTSKPRAIEWAQQALGTPWSTFIQRSLAARHEAGPLTQSEVDDTVAFIHYTLERSQREAT
ncbi:MAG TPA: aminoglycoside adenylyltransferase domain-containing protein, partial [Ardenticatenaceae bacterium]|nr:aminoglycoside adenylyltransferase domain-containing protein [Ardenticatenaceae bacterium]